MTRRVFWLVLAISWLAANLLFGAEWQFYEMGNLGGSDGFGKTSQALGVSGDGRYVVGDSLATAGLGITTGTEAFMWTKPDSQTRLCALTKKNVHSSANAVSMHGRVVVGVSQAESGKRAFRWTETDGMVSLGVLPGHDESVAWDVSGDGKTIIGESSSLFEEMAFRWAAGKMSTVGDLPGGETESVAMAISDGGTTIVGHSSSQHGTEAFRWTADGGIHGLGGFQGPRFGSRAFAVSGHGKVVVGDAFSEQGLEAFRWTEETGMIGLGDLPGGEFRSKASGVSADGTTIVGTATSELGSEAFIWQAETGMQSLGQLLRNHGVAAKWRLQNACGVSKDGTVIVGTGRNPKGETAGWIAEQHVTESSSE